MEVSKEDIIRAGEITKEIHKLEDERKEIYGIESWKIKKYRAE